jgi:hypothetical protein
MQAAPKSAPRIALTISRSPEQAHTGGSPRLARIVFYRRVIKAVKLLWRACG